MILLFAGTTEGRELTEYILAKHPDAGLTVCTATGYGAHLLPDMDEGINFRVISERLDEDRIYELIRSGCRVVIDATHPHAVIVTENIKKACERAREDMPDLGYLRVIRQELPALPEDGDVVYAASVSQAVDYLKGSEGNIFSAIGVKALGELTAIDAYESRVYARILPDGENIKRAEELGFHGAHLICMQGPFSEGLNRALFQELSIKYLITKESGKSGGFDEKLRAARAVGVKTVVIKRPVKDERGMTLSEAKAFIDDTAKSDTPSWCSEPLTAGKMKRGITTGSCAALAAKAAAYMAVTGERRKNERLITPGGMEAGAKIFEISIGDGEASCAVKKYSGDDPDITNGVFVYASVQLCDGDIQVEGGEGIGTVTKPGLLVPVGEKAINPVPARMIRSAVAEMFEELEYDKGARVCISIPEGTALAARTFNPRMGIEGGISVLGTTGIIEPMSNEAFIEAVGVRLDILRAAGITEAVLTPGSIGEELAVSCLKISPDSIVQYGNFVGDTIDMAARKGFTGIHLAGHMGKLVKIAAGLMDTRAYIGDARMETLGAHAAMAGADPEVVRAIMECLATDEAIKLIARAGVLRETVMSVLSRIIYHIRNRLDRAGFAHGLTDIRVTVFTGKDDRMGERLWFTL